MRNIIQLIRVKSWLKNILILLPLALQSSIWSLYNLFLGLFAIVAFSFTASIVYIMNDIMDVESDRQHPEKRYRPIASGSMSIVRSIVVILFLSLLVIGSFYFFRADCWPLIVYLFTNLIYTFYLKRVKYLDVINLSFFYILRLIFGVIIFNLHLSPWLVVFIILITLSVSIQKRFLELELFGVGDSSKRDYSIQDTQFLRIMGAALFLSSIIIMNLYMVLELRLLLYYHYIIINYLILYFAFLFMSERSTDDPIKLLFSSPRLLVTGLAIVLYIILVK